MDRPDTNDVCDRAVWIGDPNPGLIEGDLTEASNDYDPGPGGCTGRDAAGRDLVYVVDLGCGEFLWLDYFPETYDGSIYLVTDCSDIAGTCVEGADENGAGGEEFLLYLPDFPGRFFIIVDANGLEAGGPFTVECTIGEHRPRYGACCFPDGHCEYISEFDCLTGVQYLCVPCDPDPCSPTAIVERSWGALKQLYH